MLKASNCVSNLYGVDRDVAAEQMRQAIKNQAKEHTLPSAHDLDVVAAEELARTRTTTNDQADSTGYSFTVIPAP